MFLTHSKNFFIKERSKINKIWGFAGHIISFRGTYVVHACSITSAHLSTNCLCSSFCIITLPMVITLTINKFLYEGFNFLRYCGKYYSYRQKYTIFFLMLILYLENRQIVSTILIQLRPVKPEKNSFNIICFNV